MAKKKKRKEEMMMKKPLARSHLLGLVLFFFPR